jgi:hypothetical protein
MSDTFITPTPGRIVWYRGADGEVRPAIVIKGYGLYSADLYVFPLNAADGDWGIKPTVTHADPDLEPGCWQSWHWMPYQKQQAEKHAAEPIVLGSAGAPSNARVIGGVALAEQFDFGLAIHALKSGAKVARAGWNGKGMFVFLVPGSQFAVSRPPLLGIYPEGTPISYRPHIDIKNADGSIATWAPSGSDALAEDWMIVE